MHAVARAPKVCRLQSVPAQRRIVVERGRCDVSLMIGLLLTAAMTTTPAASVETTTASAAVEKTPIYLQTDAEDSVGSTCVTELRAALQRSSSYETVMNPMTARFVVGVLTMDPNEAESASAGSTGRSTVAAVTLQRENAAGLNQFVYSWVLVARPDNVGALVSQLVAAIDSEIRDLEGPTLRISDNVPAAAK
jgi:hypothetical protein